jgi:hypothetical protein
MDEIDAPDVGKLSGNCGWKVCDEISKRFGSILIPMGVFGPTTWAPLAKETALEKVPAA